MVDLFAFFSADFLIAIKIKRKVTNAIFEIDARGNEQGFTSQSCRKN